MNKKYFDGGAYQVLPMVLATMLAAPFGSKLLEWLGSEPTVLWLIVAGSICGTVVGVVSWLVMVMIDIARSPKS